ncbi:MAG TPA: uroporphyrinogen-III synthase [Acidimicrobiales bacterium]|nr:uroporphyrinogen-III synthase [Acidimicrobiales bacterium]
MATGQLRGFSVATTADRRREEQAVLLGRMGFEVRAFPLLQTGPASTSLMRAVTERMSLDPPDFLLANTGYGMRTWLGAAAEWGQSAALVKALATSTTIVARGAKALGELRKFGLDASYKAPEETLEQAGQWLLDRDIAGKSVVVQLHGEAADDLLSRLRGAGAEVTALPVYRMHTGEENVRRALVHVVLEGSVDAVTFTAAPQVHALWQAARAQQVPSQLLNAFNNTGVVAACIGDVCANVARTLGIEHPLVPDHPRLGSMANALGTLFESRRLRLVGEHGTVRVSGALVELSHQERWLDPAAQRAVRALRGERSMALENLARVADCTPAEVSALSRALDGGLEISGGQARLLTVTWTA